MNFGLDVLKINPAKETEEIADFIKDRVKRIYRRRGVVV